MSKQTSFSERGLRVPLAPLALALAIAACATAPAAAGSTNSTFNVTATVASDCKLSAGNLALGNYVPGAGPVTATSTISVNCTRGTAFTVKLGAGQGSGATVGNRTMVGSASATDLLNYQLYQDSAHTIAWGDGTGGTSTEALTGQGMGAAQTQALTVYGQIADSATNQTAAPDSYSDTITVSVSY